MRKPSNEELQWKLQAMERKLAATTDLVVFMAAHLGEVAPQRADFLSQQLRELQQIDGVQRAQEFDVLVERLRAALGHESVPLDSLK